MNWFALLMIYILFWTISAFMVLPFHAGDQDDPGIARVPGQAESAPPVHRPLSILLWTTIVSATLFGLFLLNYRFGWVTPEMLDLFHDPIP